MCTFQSVFPLCVRAAGTHVPSCLSSSYCSCCALWKDLSKFLWICISRVVIVSNHLLNGESFETGNQLCALQQGLGLAEAPIWASTWFPACGVRSSFISKDVLAHRAAPAWEPPSPAHPSADVAALPRCCLFFPRCVEKESWLLVKCELRRRRSPTLGANCCSSVAVPCCSLFHR